MSKTLAPSKEDWSTYQKEMQAIITAVQMWRSYLLGQKFHIYTDHQSLRNLLEQRVSTPDQHKWVSKLLGYDYEIHYRPGPSNVVADGLSWLSGGEVLATVTGPLPQFWDALRALTDTDIYLQGCRDTVVSEVPGHYSFRQGLVFFRGCIVLPPGSSMVTTVLQEYHDSPFGGHSGVERTLRRIQAQFYWPRMSQDVKDCVASCDTCQRVKASHLRPAGLLQPLPVPERVWEDISMDFIIGLPPFGGKTVLFVVVDRLTKYAHFMALAHPYTTQAVAEQFVSRVVQHHGFLRFIVSDRDSVFLSHFLQEVFTMAQTTLRMSSAYQPQTDGQMEVVNRYLEQYLRCFAHQQPRWWLALLPWAELWYNSTYHRAIQTTPFEALYGRLPPSLVRYQSGTSQVDTVDRWLETRDEALEQLKANLAAANNKMK
ncbi:unnamed protein product [Linum trigynum]|uniref:Integrase catalytic domain-containing protein n=1 Tax=Linum trigynum TaxID=586398 RepID=A0AAV2FXD1_9ROSI